jgi:hypothetical protein
MSVNDPDHAYCKKCGMPMEYTGMEKTMKHGRQITLFFYACMSKLPEHDKAVYETETAEDNG